MNSNFKKKVLDNHLNLTRLTFGSAHSERDKVELHSEFVYNRRVVRVLTFTEYIRALQRISKWR
jgi:hypothetical protein